MGTRQINLTLDWDEQADAGYIVTNELEPGQSVARTIPIQDRDGELYGAIDLAEDGALLGIEILGVSKMLMRTT